MPTQQQLQNSSRVKSAIKAGRTVEQIVGDFGVTKNYVWNQRAQMGLGPRQLANKNKTRMAKARAALAKMRENGTLREKVTVAHRSAIGRKGADARWSKARAEKRSATEVTQALPNGGPEDHRPGTVNLAIDVGDIGEVVVRLVNGSMIGTVRMTKTGLTFVRPSAKRQGSQIPYESLARVLETGLFGSLPVVE